MFLGIDLGTTAVKISCFDDAGILLYTKGKKNNIPVHTNVQTEMDPDKLWLNIITLILDMPALMRYNLKSICFSSQGEGFLVIDSQGKPLSNIILSYDKRAKKETEEIRNAFGDEAIYNITGQINSSVHTANKIKWFLNNNQLNLLKDYKFCCVSDFIISCFGLPPSIDYSLAARTMMLDIHTLKWSQPILDFLKINSEYLPIIHPAGTILGSPKKQIIQHLGFAPNIQIVQGGHDQCCTKFGSNAYSSGEAAYSLGTTETLVCELDNFDPSLRKIGLPCYPHIVPNKFVTLSGNFTGGNLLEWYLNQFEKTECGIDKTLNKNRYEIIIDEMSSYPTNIFVLPHFTTTGAPHNDDASVGTIVGLHLETSRSDIIRSLYEGITYEILLNLTLLKERGITINKLYASGGMTKSNKIMQLKADILGVPIEVQGHSEIAGKGAAILGMKALNFNSNLCINNKNEIHNSITFFPNIDYNDLYCKHFRKYRKIYKAIKTIYEE